MNPRNNIVNIAVIISTLQIFLGVNCSGRVRILSVATGERYQGSQKIESTASRPDMAYDFLCRTMDVHRKMFYVYSDEGNGGNHFLPSGWMGDWGDIIFDGACTTEPYSDSTCIRVTYLARGSQRQDWAGVYWQAVRPNNWGDFPGYDLTGAMRLIFYMRGARGGEKIEIKCGGINRGSYRQKEKPYQDSFGPVSTGVIQLTREWRRYEIDLRDQDLSMVIGGFCFATNIHQNSRGGTFYLDEAAYNLERPDLIGLLPSYAGLPWPAGKYLKNVAFVYDNALAMLALMARGGGEDWSRVKKLADALVYAQEHDRSFSDGRLRNAYWASDLVDPLTGNARLPGWWDSEEQKWFEDRFHVSSHTGNLAWVAIALLEFYEKRGGKRYLESAQRLCDWIFNHCYDETGLGGYTGGYEGWAETDSSTNGQVKVAWKSTEHNLDVYVAFMRLYNVDGEPHWSERAFHAKRFVRAMWNNTEGHFWTGTKRCGPKENDIINRDVRPLDVNTWGVLTLGETGTYSRGVDWGLGNCFVKSCPKRCKVQGFDFNDDRDGVWFEGTAQVCLALQMMGKRESAEERLSELRKACLTEGEHSQGAIPAACHGGVTTGFDWKYYAYPHVGATAWYLMAEENYNPYWGIRTNEQVPFEGIYD